MNRPQPGFETYTAVFSICCEQMCFPPSLAQLWAHRGCIISTSQWHQDIQQWVFPLFQCKPAKLIKCIQSQPKSLMITIRTIGSLLIRRLNGKTVFKFSGNGWRKQSADEGWEEWLWCAQQSHWLIPQKEKNQPKLEFFTGCIIWTEYNLPNYTSVTDTAFLYIFSRSVSYI